MLNIWQYIKGLRISPVSIHSIDRMGEMEVYAPDGKLYYYDGSDISPFVTESGSANLINKTIDGNLNTITNIGNGSLGSGIDASKIANGSVSNIEFQYLDGVTSPIQTQLDSKQPTITPNSIDNSELAQMPAHTIKGNNTGSTANVADLTATQVTAELNLFTTSLQGVVPASGGGTTNFLRADGTFAVPPGSGGSVSTIGPINSQTKNADGLVISGSSLVAQTADPSFPGLVSTGAQTFAGQKAFNSNIVGASIIGFPDLTIQPVNPSDLTLFTAGSSRLKADGTSGINIKEISSVAALPDSGFDSLYFKSDHNLYSVDSSGNVKPIGAGTGGALNFIGLNTSFQSVNLNDITAESSTGNWATYKSGTTQPTTLTGGSPTHLTLSRTTTVGEVLDGSGSFKIVKTAANAQGEGVSVIGNVPLGYRGQIASIQIPFKIISGSLLSSDLNLFIEDVTNSTILVPYNNGVLNSPSILQASFSVPPTCAQIRVGFHFSTTSTSAITFSWDDVYVGPQQIVFGPAMTDWKNDLTFTPSASFGTTSNSNVYYRRVGDTMQVRGYFQSGTVTGSTASLGLPSSFTIDTSKFSSGTNLQAVGISYQIFAGSSAPIYTSVNAPIVFYDGSTNSSLFFSTNSGANTFVKLNTSSFVNSNDFCAFEFEIPIVGWTTSVASVNSSVFNVSSILQNGTRVTGSAPTQLGQYRSYLRNAGASTFTETNGSPAISPTSTNGITLYDAASLAAGDSSNQPSKYDIFVGKNKTIKAQFYSSTGRTGFVDVSPNSPNTSSFGYYQDYDPTTGIYTIAGSTVGTASIMAPGIDSSGGALVSSPIYFDIIVSENSLAVQTDVIISASYYLSTSPSVTSGTPIDFDTKIFDTHGAVTTGASWKFTAPVTGKYQISSTANTVTNDVFSIYLNGSSYAAFGETGGTVQIVSGSKIIPMLAGDFIDVRPNVTATLSGGSAPFSTYIDILKIGN